MAELYYCKISSVNYASGTADVTIPDHENQVVTTVPFLAWAYDMPNAGDLVAAIFKKTGGRIGRGVILGKIFSGANLPKINGAGIFCKELDGAAIIYSSSDKCMEITAKKLIVEEVEYKKATEKG